MFAELRVTSVFRGSSVGLLAFFMLTSVGHAQTTNPVPAAPSWLTRPLSLVDCLNVALTQNSAILKSKHDLEASHGVVIQTRAIVLPKVQGVGNYDAIDKSSIELPPFPTGVPGLPDFRSIFEPNDQSWNSRLQLVQSIYEGGRMASALRSARLIKDQALLRHQAVINDTLLDVRIAYANILYATNQIRVREASVQLLRKELDDTRSRYEAGTVPRFNLLRAGVEVTNALPALIQARNLYRISKNNLSNLLGYNVPKEVQEDIPLQLTDTLTYEPYSVELSSAIGQALERRPELKALRKYEQLQREALKSARAGYLPSVQLYGGYGWRSSNYSRDLTEDVSGWFTGVRASWDIFDGLLTKGKVDEAKALHKKSIEDINDHSRRIELEVRTAYSNFIEAKEVLEAQQNVIALAEESLRLAMARSEAGTGTQLDVLNAETSLTQARTSLSLALREYWVARARLERAIGQDIMTSTAVSAPAGNR